MKNTLQYCFLFCLLLISTFIHAQSKKQIDSLQKLADIEARRCNVLANKFLNINLDSVIVYAAKSISISEKNNLFDQLAEAHFISGKAYYFKSDYSNALKQANLLKEIANSSKKNEFFIKYHNLLGNINIDQGNTDKALKEYEAMITLSKINNDVYNLSAGYNNMAYIYRNSGRFDKAIELLFKKIKLDEERKDVLGYLNARQQIAVIYLQNNDLKNAKDHIDESLDGYKKINDLRNMAINHNLLSVYYSKCNDSKNAINNLKIAIALAEKVDDKRSVAIFTSELARYYMEANEYDMAEKLYIKAITLHENINLQKTFPSILNGYAQTLLSLGKIDEAKKSAEKALYKSEILNAPLDKKEAYNLLSDIYILSKDSDKAIQYKKKYIALRDSLFTSDNNRLLQELNTKYQTEKKEAKIILLNSQNELQKTLLDKNKLQIFNDKLELDKKNLQIGNQGLELKNSQIVLAKNSLELKNKEQQINILNLSDKNKTLLIQKKNRQILFGLIAVVLLAALAYSLYNRYKLQQKARLQEAVIQQQDEAAKAVINAEENERQRMSATLHDGLGQLLSVVKMNLQAVQESTSLNEKMLPVYANTIALVDESIKEMRNVSHQIITNNVLRVGLGNALKDLVEKIDSNKLKINFNIDGLLQNIDPDIQIVLYRIFQESINNVIKHSRANKLDINANLNDKTLFVSIEDNGIGFDLQHIKNNRGIGLDNIKTRIKFLKGFYDIKSSPGKGCKITMQIPV